MLAVWVGQTDQRTLFRRMHRMEDEIRKLWKEVEEASRASCTDRGTRCVYKGKKAFGYGLQVGGATPENTTVQELMSD